MKLSLVRDKVIFRIHFQELDLSRNQLRGFDDYLVDKLLRIESIKFDKNPFTCDLCNMGALLDRQKEVSLLL